MMPLQLTHPAAAVGHQLFWLSRSASQGVFTRSFQLDKKHTSVRKHSLHFALCLLNPLPGGFFFQEAVDTVQVVFSLL